MTARVSLTPGKTRSHRPRLQFVSLPHRTDLEREVCQPAGKCGELRDLDLLIGLVVGFFITWSPSHGLDSGMYKRIRKRSAAAADNLCLGCVFQNHFDDRRVGWNLAGE